MRCKPLIASGTSTGLGNCSWGRGLRETVMNHPKETNKNLGMENGLVDLQYLRH